LPTSFASASNPAWAIMASCDPATHADHRSVRDGDNAVMARLGGELVLTTTALATTATGLACADDVSRKAAILVERNPTLVLLDRQSVRVMSSRSDLADHVVCG
jgi:hypothetical protein